MGRNRNFLRGRISVAALCWRLVGLAALSWASATGPGGAQQSSCADPGASCGAKVDRSCLRSLGAGAIAAASADCDAQLTSYRDCLALFAEECGAVGASEPRAAPAVSPNQPPIEMVWDAIKDSDNPELFDLFASDFENSGAGATLVALARQRARELRAEQTRQAALTQSSEFREGGFDYIVTGLNPRGDNFLALKSGPGLDYYKLREMGPNTRLQVLGAEGAWLNVRLEDGAEGWAHGNWIQRVGGGASGGGGRLSCDGLWHARNAIWNRYGYCFAGARGKAAFDNSDCYRNVEEARRAMSTADLAEVERLDAQERAQGCK